MPEDEEKKKRPLPEGKEKEETREGQQQQPPTCSSGQHRRCSLTTTKLLSGQVQAAAPMGLPKMLTGQFVFLQQPNNNLAASWMKLQENNMIITIPSLIAAGIATAMVTGGITGTAVYRTAGDANVVTGDQIKTEGGLHILELGHMEPWAIAMMCVTVLIGMGTCGACCHKRGKCYVTEKEAKLRDPALGRAKELVHRGAHGADKLLQDVQTYHDMHHKIVVQKMHQITQPRTGGRYGERPCRNPQCSECPKPKHIAVSFSSSKQKATIISENEDRGPSPAPSAASSPTAGVDAEVYSNWAAPIWSQAQWDEAKTPSPANGSPAKRIAARTPTPPRISETPNDPFDNGTPDDLFISPHLRKWNPIVDGRREETPENKEDFNRLLKKQGEQNERDMQDIPGHVGRKANNYAKLYAKERLLAKQSEQKHRQAFNMLQKPGNKQKLRRPHVLTTVPMGLPFTSADWNEEDSDNWCRKHVPNWNEDRRIIDVVSDDDRMESYYHEGKKLYKVPQRRLKKTDATYKREDLDLAASLCRNAAAAAAACTPADAWE
jgi:hypothetical protein